MDKTLRQAYQKAIYAIEWRGETHKFQLGQPAMTLVEALTVNEAASALFLTAENPASSLVSESENMIATLALQAELCQRELKYLKGWGGDKHGDWPKETSFLIFDIEIEAAHQLARQFGQNAFLWVDSRGQARLVETGMKN